MSSIRIVTSEGPEQPAAYLAGLLTAYDQAGKHVALLLPGGSSIAVAAAAYRLLGADLPRTITVLLTDERYGDVGHPDSNWLQLEQAGIPVGSGTGYIPVLTGRTMEETIADFDANVREAFAEADVVIGIFGMGADGHTCGVLPNSPAVDASDLAAGYDAGQYRRITMTPQAIAKVDIGLLCLSGETKRSAYEAWQSDQPLAEQPAQILKTIPSLTVFTDL